MGKAWYHYFLVTDQSDQGASPIGSPGAAPHGGSAAQGRTVAELVPGLGSDGNDSNADLSPAAAATNLAPLAEIYDSARIAAPAHGYTVLKVADMLESEHIQTLPPDVKRKSILVALEAAGVAVDDVVADAVHRDRALDTYERVLLKSLDDFRAEKLAENARLEQEIGERLKELRARIEENNQGVTREVEQLRAWQSRKQVEERRIAEAVGYFVSENPISTTASATTSEAKGDANAR